MKYEEMVEILNDGIKKIQSAISDLGYAGAYADSIASSSYCSSAKSYLRKTEKIFAEIVANADTEVVALLNSCLGNVKRAISNVGYATSYEHSSAAINYCDYARRTLRAVYKSLTDLISTIAPNKDVEEQQNPSCDLIK